MAKHGNILSFDEARARGAVRTRPASSRSSVERNSHSAYRNHASEQVKRTSLDGARSYGHASYAHAGSAQGARRQPSWYHAPSSHQQPASRHYAVRQHDTLEAEDAVRDTAQLSHQMANRKDKKSLSHRARSAKAERQFNRTIGAEEARKSMPEQTSRAAVYEMKMGRNHKRSSRVLNDTRSGKRSRGGFLSGIFSAFDPRSSKFSAKLVIGFATALLAVCMLYQPVASFYGEIRTQQQLQAEYEVVADYYSSLKSEVDYLNTQEGMEDFVRKELGWVKPGEHVVSVTGVNIDGSSIKKGSVTSDLSGAVPAPTTWYSGVLDFVFGYNKI